MGFFDIFRRKKKEKVKNQAIEKASKAIAIDQNDSICETISPAQSKQKHKPGKTDSNAKTDTKAKKAINKSVEKDKTQSSKVSSLSNKKTTSTENSKTNIDTKTTKQQDNITKPKNSAKENKNNKTKQETQTNTKPIQNKKKTSLNKEEIKTNDKVATVAVSKEAIEAQKAINEEASLATEVSKTTRSGKFEIKKTKDSRFVFNLYASNHVIVATSQIYTSVSSALGGIKSIAENAPKAHIEDQTIKGYQTLTYPKWEIYVDHGGQYRFRLNASNGSCICHSQGYTKKASCKNGIDSIIRFAKDAEIEKAYLNKEN